MSLLNRGHINVERQENMEHAATLLRYLRPFAFCENFLKTISHFAHLEEVVPKHVPVIKFFVQEKKLFQAFV